MRVVSLFGLVVYTRTYSYYTIYCCMYIYMPLPRQQRWRPQHVGYILTYYTYYVWTLLCVADRWPVTDGRVPPACCWYRLYYYNRRGIKMFACKKYTRIVIDIHTTAAAAVGSYLLQ